jgi:hypothetical protein
VTLPFADLAILDREPSLEDADAAAYFTRTALLMRAETAGFEPANSDRARFDLPSSTATGAMACSAWASGFHRSLLGLALRSLPLCPL